MKNKEKLQKAVNVVFKKYSKNKVMAVYVSGSYLNNLMTETSDVDLYVVLEQSKRSLVFGQFKSGQEHGENDFKFMESYKFVQLLYKTNPNMLELVFEYPVYVNDKFKPLADFLYDNKNKLVKMNQERYYSSCYHMLKNNYNKLKNGSGKVALNYAGKEVMNFYKVYYQAKACSKDLDLSNFVKLSGDLQQKLMEYKLKKSYTESEKQLELKNMEDCLKELSLLKDKFVDTNVDELFFEKMLSFL